jgi:hypothetical protein
MKLINCFLTAAALLSIGHGQTDLCPLDYAMSLETLEGLDLNIPPEAIGTYNALLKFCNAQKADAPNIVSTLPSFA